MTAATTVVQGQPKALLSEQKQRSPKKVPVCFGSKLKSGLNVLRQLRFSDLKLGRSSLMFIPGILLVCMSAAALLLPKLLMLLASLFLFFAGVALSYAAWKLIQLKSKVQSLLKHVEGRLIIQGVAPQELFEEQNGRESNKKIVLH